MSHFSQVDLNTSSPLQLAKYYLERREFNDALRHTYLAKKQGYDQTEVLKMAATIKMEMNFPADAFELLSHALRLSPSSHEVYSLFGIFYHRNHLPTRSLEHFIKALRLAPDYKPAWEGIMSLYLKCGHLDVAEEILSQLLQYFPSQSSFIVNKLLISISDPDQLVRSLENLLQYSTTPPHILGSVQCNIAFIRWCTDKYNESLLGLLQSMSLPANIFVSHIYSKDLCDALPNKPIILPLLLLPHSPATAFSILKSMPPTNINVFWKSVALAESGECYDLLKWADKACLNDDILGWVMRAFAVGRYGGDESHVAACLDHASEMNPDMLIIKYERALHFLRTSSLSQMESLLSTLLPSSVHTKRLQVIYLYKKKNMSSMRQSMAKLRDMKDEWGSYWKCKVCMITGSNDFDRYYDELQPKTYEWTIRKLLIGIKRALQIYSTVRANGLLHTLHSKLSSWSLFLEPEIVKLKEKCYLKYRRLKARCALRSDPERAAKIFWRKIHNKIEDIELELKIMAKTQSMKETMKRAQQFVDKYYNDVIIKENYEPSTEMMMVHSVIWREIALILAEKEFIPQALQVFTSHGAAARFPRIDLLTPLIHLGILLDIRDTIGTYLSKLDMSMIPRSETIRYEFYRAFNAVNEVTVNIEEWEKGIRVAQRKGEVEHMINELNYVMKTVIESGDTLSEYTKQIEDILFKYVDITRRYNRLTGRRWDEVGIHRNILKYKPDTEFALKFMINQPSESYEAIKEYYMRLLLPQKITKREQEENFKIIHQFVLLLFTKSDFDTLQRLLNGIMYDDMRDDYEFYNEMKEVKRFILRRKGSSNIVEDAQERLYRFFSRWLTFCLGSTHWNVLQDIYAQLPTNDETIKMRELISFQLHKLDERIAPSYGFLSSIDRAYSNIGSSFFNTAVESLESSQTSSMYRNHMLRLKLSEKDFMETFVNDRLKQINNPYSIEQPSQSEEQSDDTIWRVLAYVMNVDSLEAITSKICSMFRCISDGFRDLDYVIHDWCLSNQKFNKRWKKVTKKTKGEIIDKLKQVLEELSIAHKSQVDMVSEFMKNILRFISIYSNWNRFMDNLCLETIFDKNERYEVILRYVSENHIDIDDLDWRTLLTLSDAYVRTLVDSFNYERHGKLALIVIAFYERVLMDCAIHNNSIQFVIESLGLRSEKHDFTTFIDMFFSNISNYNSTLIVEQGNILSNSIRSLLPIFMDVLAISLDHNSLYYKRLVLILCALTQLKFVYAKSLELSQYIRTISVIFCKVESFAEKEMNLLFASFDSFFTNSQFLLDLCSYVPSDRLMRKICHNLYEERIEILCSMRMLFHSHYFDQIQFVKHLTQILRIRNRSLVNVKLSEIGNHYEMSLLYDNNDEKLVEVSRDEFCAETDGIFLIQRMEQDLCTEQFLSIGSLRFSNRSKIVSIRQSINASPRGDPMQHLQSIGVDSSLLSWKTVSKVKTKRNTIRMVVENMYLFDKEWYESVEHVIVDIAKYSAVGWVIGLCNRTQETIGFYGNRIVHTSVGYYANSLPDLVPFRMATDMRRIIGSIRNGKSIFERAFISCLERIISPRGSRDAIFSLVSILMRNSRISVQEKVIQDTELTQNLSSKIVTDKIPRDLSVIVAETMQIDASKDGIARFETLLSDRDETLGDPYLLKLIKRKVKLAAELSEKLEQEMTKDAQQSILLPSQTISKTIDVTSYEPIDQVIQPQVVLDRLLMRLQRWVVISSHDREGMVHCGGDITELSNKLKEQSESEIALAQQTQSKL